MNEIFKSILLTFSFYGFMLILYMIIKFKIKK